MEKFIDNMIEEICDKCLNEDSFTGSKEAEEVDKKIYKLFWNNKLFSEIRFDLDGAITEAEDAYKKQGFILGFKKAIELFEKGGYVK